MVMENINSLTKSDRKLILKLLQLEEASTYTLAKLTEMSYASMFISIRKLESMNLVAKLREVESRKRGRKIIYGLTQRGREVARSLMNNLWRNG